MAALGVALAIGMGLWLWGTLPDTDGSLRVAGVSATVEIGRDRHGVPHIRAASADDAYFGLGFVHAQDRFWQMEAMRRLATGRLSEVIGPPTLGRDRFMRTLGFSRLVEIQFERLEGPVRRAFVAYAAGVNAWLERRRWLLPPEFMALRYRPEPWRPTDSLLWSKVMALDLSPYWRDKVLRLRLTGRLTGEQIDQLWPQGFGAGTATKFDLPDTLIERLAEALPGPAREPRGASNSWVVAGSRTTGGKPILANDPHLGFRAPILWYLARLSAPGLDVTGATLPGFPFTVLGHNGRIAWGMSSAENDQLDLFVERPLEGDPTRYRTPDGPRRFQVRREIIVVRGAPDVKMTVRQTRHGPVLSDIGGGLGKEAGDVLALAAVFLRPDDTTPQALYRVNRARNWGEFTAALEEFDAPQMTFTYADTAGNIGFIMPGKVPVRRSGRGRIPAPGWTGEADWSGFVPFAELPRAFNPTDGKLVAANQDPTPPGYPHYITANWSPGYRARRIDELLDGIARHDADTTARIQLDTQSLMARHLLPLMLRVTPRSLEAKWAIARLGAWDGTMSRDRPEPAVFTAWLRALNRAVYGDELGPLLGGYWSLRPRFMVAALGGRRREWCDDVGTAAEETCAGRLELALEEALRLLSERLGPDMEKWRWGDLHQARFRHPVLGRLPVVGRLVNLSIETDGGAYTVNRGASRVGDELAPFEDIHGPGMRAIYDLADLERSRFMIATGQSGNPVSRHYRDLLEPWRDGRTLTIPAEGRPVGRLLKLVPANRQR